MIGDLDRLLLCTNGAEVSFPAMEYGTWLARRLDLDVTLLGIEERPAMRAALESLLERVRRILEEDERDFIVVRRSGRGHRVIPDLTHTGGYLTVLGPLGRGLWHRWLRGRSFRRIQEQVPTPVIYTRKAHLQCESMLVCMGGLGYAQGVLNLSLLLASRMGAGLTVLHVVEPITYDYPTAHEVGTHWEAVIETDTPHGRNLREALNKAEQAGVPIEFRVRNGNPVHEIVEEIRGHPYDLVGMGSPYSAHSLRRLYSPNVTAEVAEAVDCAILTLQFDPGSRE